MEICFMKIPIYYDGKLISMNRYRNAHWSIQNKEKQALHGIIKDKIHSQKQIGQFKTHYRLYTKTFGCDGSNIIAMIEKYYLDTINEANIIKDDNLNNHIGSSREFAGIDSKDPRAEVDLIEVK